MKRLQPGEPGYENDIIENNEEDILPLREERKVGHRSSLCFKSAEEPEVKLDEVLGGFELRLSQNHGKAAFDIFCEYIYWTRANYPNGLARQSKLSELIERICFDFCEEQTLKEDQQYFEYWVKYLKFTEQSGEVFTLLDANKIGVNLSARYVEEASYYEKQNKIDLALEVYKHGLKHDTLPPGALKRSYKTFQNLHLANNSCGVTPLDSAAKQPKIKRMEILRDPEGAAALEALADNTLSNYDSKSIQTQENIIAQTTWGALKIPQGTVVKHCRSKVKVMKDELEPAHLNFKDIPASSGPCLASSNASSDAYFVERGSAPPDQLSWSAHGKKESHTACPLASNRRLSLPFSGSVEVEKKQSFGLPRCSSVPTLDFKYLSKISSYLEDSSDETFLSLESSRDTSIAHSNFGTPFDPNSLEFDMTMPQKGSLELAMSPTTKVLFSHPTISTRKAMEDSDNLYKQAFDLDPGDFFTYDFASSDEES